MVNQGDRIGSRKGAKVAPCYFDRREKSSQIPRIPRDHGALCGHFAFSERRSGLLKGLLHVRQNRAGTIPILANLMRIQDAVAAKIYDLVLPGLTADGSVSPELQKKVIEFILKVQGLKEPAATDKIFDFPSVRKGRIDLEAKRWKPF